MNSKKNISILNETVNLKDSELLKKEYEEVLNLIYSNQSFDLIVYLDYPDIRYYLKNNELDYNLFIACIKTSNEKSFEDLLQIGFVFNLNTILIELYRLYMYKKNESLPSTDNEREFLSYKDFLFILNYQEGLLIKENSLAEFYFLLMTNEFELATCLLSKSSSSILKSKLLNVFIDDDSSILKGILFSEDIIIESVRSSLERGMDGVGL